MTEKLYDEDGNLIMEQPYRFRRLFAVGQEQVINSTPMTILSCEKIGDTVTTRVRLHRHWPNTADEQRRGTNNAD